MAHKDPVEYTGKVLDQRNDLTAPDEGATYPERPKHVPIKDTKSNNRK